MYTQKRYSIHKNRSLKRRRIRMKYNQKYPHWKNKNSYRIIKGIKEIKELDSESNKTKTFHTPLINN